MGGQSNVLELDFRTHDYCFSDMCISDQNTNCPISGNATTQTSQPSGTSYSQAPPLATGSSQGGLGTAISFPPQEYNESYAQQQQLSQQELEQLKASTLGELQTVYENYISNYKNIFRKKPIQDNDIESAKAKMASQIMNGFLQCGKEVVQLARGISFTPARGKFIPFIPFRETGDSIKEYGCIADGKKYATVDNLYRHMLSHDIAKQIQCPQCTTTFTRADNLKRHIDSVCPRKQAPQAEGSNLNADGESE